MGDIYILLYIYALPCSHCALMGTSHVFHKHTMIDVLQMQLRCGIPYQHIGLRCIMYADTSIYEELPDRGSVDWRLLCAACGAQLLSDKNGLVSVLSGS